MQTKIQTNDRAQKLRLKIDHVKISMKTKVNLYKLTKKN